MSFTDTRRNRAIVHHIIASAQQAGFTVTIDEANLFAALYPLSNMKVEAIKVLRLNIRKQDKFWIDFPPGISNVTEIASNMVGNQIVRDDPIGLKEAKDIADILWHNMERND